MFWRSNDTWIYLAFRFTLLLSLPAFFPHDFKGDSLVLNRRPSAVLNLYQTIDTYLPFEHYCPTKPTLVFVWTRKVR